MHFTHGPLSLHYRSYGKGPTPILAFHGFGRTGEDFRVFEQALGDRCTLYAFDLPFHGGSPSPAERADQPYKPAELGAYFSAFADRFAAERFVLMGYSLGGRVALSLLETMPERIAHAVLIAPDGLKQRPWYRALASSSWGRARYRSFIDRPGRVHHLVHTLRGVGLIRDKMHRFILGQTDSHVKRRLLHDVWLSYRALEPDLGAVAENLRTRRIQLELIFGSFDKVIPPSLGHRLAGRAPEWIHVHEVPLGHQLLTKDVAARVADLLARDAARR